MVIGLMAAAAGGVASSMWGQLSVEDFMQNYFPNYLTTGRNMMADQKLQRKYFEIEMRLERQNLHRDDIRDLMELTVGRMDIYHVVGTLILTFCIEWFTDADILQADVPDWFRTLFLISNFSAVGYLMFSVWLAMHASIAAHSVGVRLLTSFARLSIPTREQLKKLRITFVPKLEEFMSLVRHVGILGSESKEKQSGAPSEPSAARPPSELTVSALASARVAAGLGPEVTTAMESGGRVGAAQDVDAGEDDTQHFERYIQEQRTWLGFDAYSRVCMSLGVNQMLQALSYYVVGILWEKNLTAAIIAFFGVKGVAFALLRLDITGMADNWREYLAVLFFMSVPTASACTGFLVSKHADIVHEDLVLGLMVTPCFILHGLWILYVALDMELRLGGCRGPGSDTGLPRRIRTVNYLGVCDQAQRRLADDFRAEEAEGRLTRVRAACDELKALMQTARDAEAAGGQSSRSSEELREAREQLVEALDAARALGVSAASKAAQRELELAAQDVERFDIWQQAPKIQAALQALRDEKVRDYLTEEQKKTIEQSYQEFLQQCRVLDVCLPAVAAQEESTAVRFNVDDVAQGDYWLPNSVWVGAGDGAVRWEQPACGTTSFKTAMVQEQAWRTKATNLSGARSSSPLGQGEAQESRRSANHVSELLPPGAVPEGQLPQRIVRRFTKGTAMWWGVAAVLHVVQTLRGRCFEPPRLETQVVARLSTQWPGRAAFCEVSSLNCNATHVLLADRFTHFAAEWLPGTEGLGGLQELGEAGVAAEFSWLGGTGSSDQGFVPVQTPSSWRIAAVAWEPCAVIANTTTCNEAWLAGWDGSSVVLASTRLDPAAGAWRTRPQFQVHPGMGRHVGAPARRANASHETYSDVRALHLAPGGRALAVLLGGGQLDLWNLAAGVHLGRWRLPGGEYSALCREGAELLLARHAEDGPVLEIARLPPAAVPSEPNAAARLSRGRPHFLEAKGGEGPGSRSERLLEV